MKYIHTLLKFIFSTLALTLLFSCGVSRKELTKRLNVAGTPYEYTEVAQEYANRRDFNKAIQVYNIFIETYIPQKSIYDKELAWAHYEIGFCYFQKYDFNNASSHFKIVIEEYLANAPRTLARQRLEEIRRIESGEQRKYGFGPTPFKNKKESPKTSE